MALKSTERRVDELELDKQDNLVSGVTIKTINGNSVLGSGNLTVGGSASWGGITGTLSTQTDLQSALDAKQEDLVSGTNIKTINSTSLLGSGDVAVQPTLVSGTNIKTINGNTLLGSGDLTIGGGGLTVGTTPVTSGTDTRVFFQQGGVIQQDANFTFNNTQKRLTLRANGLLATDIPFIIRNSADTTNLVSVNGLGRTRFSFDSTGTDFIAIEPQLSEISMVAYSGLKMMSLTNTQSFFGFGVGAYRMGIGTNSPAARLDVRAQGALSTDIGFRVRNSANTADMFTVNGDGTQNWFLPANNALNSIKSSTFNVIQYGNDAFGNIAVGYNSSNMIVPTTTYNTVLGASASSGVNSSFAIGIGWGSIVNGAGNICIGRTRTIGSYSIKIGYDGGASQYGGTNSIHLGRTTSGNNIEADNVFMTYFNSQSSSTLTRSNGSFGLLGQQAYIITNGTGTLGLTTFMGDGGNTFVVRNHTSVPTLNITDSFQQYSADIVAGNAAPHFRTENGNIIKLFRGAALTASDGTLANAVTRIAQLEARLQAHGLIA